jgi:aerobic-type carbon monoxide dehydrogenase small subunit (CoxS/CutS family)
MENTVTLTINGRPYQAVNPEPYTTLNEFIRQQPDLKGTKKNCKQQRSAATAVPKRLRLPVCFAFF